MRRWTPPHPATEGEPVNVEDPTLQALVADRKGDRSYEQLAALSDGRLSRARIQQIATREMKAFPDAATLAGLAQALDVPVQEVVLATARSLGLEVRGGASGDALLVPGGKKLSTPAQDALLTMARELSKAGATDGERDATRVDRDAQRDGVTPSAGERGDAGGPLSRGWVPASLSESGDIQYSERRPRQSDYDRAADDSGPSLLEADDTRAAARGEESQDPGSDEPA